MKELIPAIWDDLELAENGVKVAATVSRMLSYEGREYELDLTQEHAAELDDFLDRYIRANRSQRGRPQPGKSISPANASRNKAIRLFAQEHGISCKTTTGKIYLDGALQAAYDAFMRGEDWEKVYDEWQPAAGGRRVRKPRLPVREPERASA